VSQRTVPIESQVQQLGQKYMGVRPDGHADYMFNGKAPQPQGGHPVPVSNFMNAQCMFSPFRHSRPNH
jgi:saccharopepsin